MKETVELLNELKFFGMKSSIEYRVTEAIESNLSHQDFLVLLLEDEHLYRKNRRCEALKKRAKFRSKAYLENFEITSDRGISKSMIQDFKSLRFIEGHQNLIFLGGTGAGKSFVAQAIGHAACSVGIEVLFVSLNRLFKELEMADKQGTYLTYMKRLRERIKLLIIDDMGLRSYSHQEATILYEILEERYQKGSVIVTSQVSPLGWKSLFEDPVIAEAICDRLTACAHTIEVKGKSFRGRHKQGGEKTAHPRPNAGRKM